MKKVLLTGATGMVGSLVLQHCLAASDIDTVIVIGRRETGVQHAKLREVILPDFTDYSEVEDIFDHVDIAYFCLGAYTGKQSDELFKTITVDYTKAFADALKNRSPQAVFCLLSGAGADRTEKSRVSFAKYKGMAENYLFQSNFKATYSLRPGYIYPVEQRNEPNLMYSISRSLYPILRLLGRNMSIKSTELAEAMFEVGRNGAPKNILENKDILNVLDA